MRASHMLVCLACTSLIPVVSHGAVHWRVNSGAVQTFTGTGGTIPVTSTTTIIRVWADSPSESIGAISVTGAASNNIDFVLGTSSTSSFPTNPALLLSPACVDFDGVTATTLATQSRLRFAGAMSDDLTGDLQVGQVFRLEVGGDLAAEVFAVWSDAGDEKTVRRIEVAGQLLADVEASAYLSGNSTIERVFAFGGIIDASITNLYGSIDEVSSGGPISIASPGSISARDGIKKITAINTSAVRQDISADIIANANGGTVGYIREITCGNLSGSVTADQLGKRRPACTAPSASTL